MRFVFSGLLRGSLVLAAVLCLVAVGLGRVAPRPASSRTSSDVAYIPINGYHFPTDDGEPRFLDPKTGKLVRLALSEPDQVDCAVCSPWRDEAGESQVIGRWIRREGDRQLVAEIGLARYTLPSGRILDRVPLDVVPVGHPCFFPGKSARILFAAGNGRLYRYAFENEDGTAALGNDDEGTAQSLTWRVDGLEERGTVIIDPVWPRDPRLAGRLIVSMTRLEKQGDRRIFGPNQLWWLQLDRAGTQIQAAGPLVRRRGLPAGTPLDEERLPNVVATADGGLVLAYLSRRDNGRHEGWNLGLAPIDIDPATGAPSVDEANVHRVSSMVTPTLPTFSSDGQWVYALPRVRSVSEHVERFSVGRVLANGPAAAHGFALNPAWLRWN